MGSAGRVRGGAAVRKLCPGGIVLAVLGSGFILNGLLSLGGWGLRVSEVSHGQIGGGLLFLVGARLMSYESALLAESSKGSERK